MYIPKMGFYREVVLGWGGTWLGWCSKEWKFRGRCRDVLSAKYVGGLGLKGCTGYRSVIGYDPRSGVKDFTCKYSCGLIIE